MGYFSFDVMGDVIYSKEYNMMRDGNGKIAAGGVETTLSKLHDGMKMLGLVGTTPWILRMVSQMGDFGDFAIMQQWCRGAMKDKLAVRSPLPPHISAHLPSLTPTHIHGCLSLVHERG